MATALSLRLYPIRYERGRLARIVVAGVLATLAALSLGAFTHPFVGFLVRGTTTSSSTPGCCGRPASSERPSARSSERWRAGCGAGELPRRRAAVPSKRTSAHVALAFGGIVVTGAAVTVLVYAAALWASGVFRPTERAFLRELAARAWRP